MLVFMSVIVSHIIVSQSMIEYPEEDNQHAKDLFSNWRKHHSKTYKNGSVEHIKYQTFLENLKIANQLNRLASKYDSEMPPTFGLSPYVDLTPKEFKQRFLNRFIQSNISSRRTSNRTKSRKQRDTNSGSVTGCFDWSEVYGVVTSVKDQGSTGACWAIAGCGNIEGLWAIKTGSSSPDLSSQAVLDCNGIFQNQALACGPTGGNPMAFYEFLVNEGGMLQESDYPFCVGNGSCSPCAPPGYSTLHCGPWFTPSCNVSESCSAKYNRSKFIPGLKVVDYAILSQNENSLAADLKNIGPLVAALHGRDLQLYTGGVLRALTCNKYNLDHVVLLTGYNITENGASYWIAKNSWGAMWGEKGFFRISFGSEACGINKLCATGFLA
ncbi:cysteine proteinase 15A [Biomphalaria glabrata]